MSAVPAAATSMLVLACHPVKGAGKDIEGSVLQDVRCVVVMAMTVIIVISMDPVGRGLIDHSCSRPISLFSRRSRWYTIFLLLVGPFTTL